MEQDIDVAVESIDPEEYCLAISLLSTYLGFAEKVSSLRQGIGNRE
ncbi:hypothetical protein SR1949_31990 [Sphaerospermopsis reniformis]|uniref:Uncharacterized protein n=1 Tax=Sphaerospermopsis reniformis TaxID=531300 RepID=A0A480A2R2_9CYAN|nr:hypothetical protein [Sphaerospermopsis reniformis]GCL38086.1 hypothetical protein SR1949_31990 [Sphaerospermopsis reniformis]